MYSAIRWFFTGLHVYTNYFYYIWRLSNSGLVEIDISVPMAYAWVSVKQTDNPSVCQARVISYDRVIFHEPQTLRSWKVPTSQGVIANRG